MSAQHATRVTLSTALQEATRSLAQHENAALEAELLLAHVLHRPRSALRGRPDQTLTPTQLAQLDALVTRRARGEPAAYLIGVRGFWSLELQVTLDVLIPRPETELLVELALQKIPADADWRIADLGTGSGAIALALARERPRCHIIATDISPAALEIARANAERLNIRNVEFRLGDWFGPLQDERFDMVVSNPPYVRSGDPHLSDLRFEPSVALVAGADGLQHLYTIAMWAREHFTPTLTLPLDGGGDAFIPRTLRLRYTLRLRSSLRGERSEGGVAAGVRGSGWLLLEHGYDQGHEMVQILSDFGYICVQDYTDLAGIPRVAVAQWKTPHA